MYNGYRYVYFIIIKTIQLKGIDVNNRIQIMKVSLETIIL